MDKRSKMSDLDIFNKPDKKEVKTTASPEHVTKSFRLTKDQAELLKEYTEKIQPGHFMITEADIIRYMILNFDLKKAQEDFFKLK
ncbi:MAG: hypothetical protein ACYDIA_10340 [Candidatus Humimicrobiaceae bacterium]